MMKAITLYEPWASLVALGEKKFETRSWATSYRGPLLVHAAKKMPGEIVFQEPFYTALKEQHSEDGGIMFPGPCILAICNLVDCQKVVSRTVVKSMLVAARLENGQEITGNELSFGDYTLGRYAWKLEDVHRLTLPIQAKGRQRLWNWDERPYQIAIDPWKNGSTKIWTPQRIRTGQQVPPGSEDAVLGLEVA